MVIECWGERLDSKPAAVLELEDEHGRRLATNRGHRRRPSIDYRVPADGDFVVRVFDLTFSGGPSMSTGSISTPGRESSSRHRPLSNRARQPA